MYNFNYLYIPGFSFVFSCCFRKFLYYCNMFYFRAHLHLFFYYFCNMLIHSSSKGGILRTKTVFKSSWSNLNWTNTVLKCFETLHGYKQTLFWIWVRLIDFESVWRCLECFWVIFDYFLVRAFLCILTVLLCTDSSGASNEWGIAYDNIWPA
jgi:hypothetical protein